MSTSDQLKRDLLADLKAVDRMIRNALDLMTPEQKEELFRLNARDGVNGEDIGRSDERAAVIAKSEGRIS